MNTLHLFSVFFCAELAATSLALGLALACRWAQSMSDRDREATQVRPVTPVPRR